MFDVFANRFAEIFGNIGKLDFTDEDFRGPVVRLSSLVSV